MDEWPTSNRMHMDKTDRVCLTSRLQISSLPSLARLRMMSTNLQYNSFAKEAKRFSSRSSAQFDIRTDP